MRLSRLFICPSFPAYAFPGSMPLLYKERTTEFAGEAAIWLGLTDAFKTWYLCVTPRR